MRIWKQQKLIDFLEENDDVDLRTLAEAYSHLGNLYSSDGQIDLSVQAKQAAQSLREFPSRSSSDVDTGKVVEAASTSASARGGSSSGSNIDVTSDAKAPVAFTVNFEKELVHSSSRPASAAILGIGQRVSSPNKPKTSATVPISLVPLVPPSKLTDQEREVQALDAVYIELQPLVQECKDAHTQARLLIEMEVKNECIRVHQEIIATLEGHLGNWQAETEDQGDGEGKSDVFKYWYDSALSDMEDLLHMQKSACKDMAHTQVSSEREGWMRMAQVQLDKAQLQNGAAEATLQVDVLVQEYKKAENEMMRWELGLLRDTQDSQNKLLSFWHQRADAQHEAEVVYTRKMNQEKEKQSEMFRSSSSSPSPFLPSLGGAIGGTGSVSPDQQRQLASLAQQLHDSALPSTYQSNADEVTRLQDQLAEWKKLAFKHITAEADKEMLKWAASIAAEVDPAKKIAVIDRIEKQRHNELAGSGADASAETGASSKKEKEKQVLAALPALVAAVTMSEEKNGGERGEGRGEVEGDWRNEFKQSMATFYAQNSVPGHKLTIDVTEKRPGQGEGEGKKSDTGEEEENETPIGPNSTKTLRFADEDNSSTGNIDAQRVVQAELERLERSKRAEMDQTMHEQKLYLQAALNQKLRLEEAEQKEHARFMAQKEIADKEAAEAAVREAEAQAMRDMEAEWARLQAIMTRNKEDKTRRMRQEQEDAEAKYGVTTKHANSDSDTFKLKTSKKIGKAPQKKRSSVGTNVGTGAAGSCNKSNVNIAKLGGVRGVIGSPNQGLFTGSIDSSEAFSPIPASYTPTRNLKLGERRVFDSTEKEAAYITQIQKRSYNVSTVGHGAYLAESEIFKSFLSKTEKMQKLEKLHEIQSVQKTQLTASRYSHTMTGSMSSAAVDPNNNPLDSDVNPLAPSKPTLKSRYGKAGDTSFDTRVDPRIKFSREDRPVIVTVTPKETSEVTKVVQVRESGELMSMLADAKQKHLEDVEAIYTQTQPKLILGQRYTNNSRGDEDGDGRGDGRGISHGGSRGAGSGGGRRPGNTNDYRAFTPDDRHATGGVPLIRNTIADEYEDDGFDGMQLKRKKLTDEENAAISARYDGRPDVSYTKPVDPTVSVLTVRTGKFILDSKMPADPGPLSPNASLYGSGAMSGKAFPHIRGNDGTVGLVTEEDVRQKSREGSVTASGSGSVAIEYPPTSSGADPKLLPSQAVSSMVSKEISAKQAARVASMTAQQRLDFQSYHGYVGGDGEGTHPQQIVVGTLGSGLDAASVLSTDNKSHYAIQVGREGNGEEKEEHLVVYDENYNATGTGADAGSGVVATMKPLPNYVSRPIKHLTATGSTGLGITGSPDRKMQAVPQQIFACPHRGCNRTFPVAFELFNHANRVHLGVVGEMANNPNFEQDYYYEEPGNRQRKGKVLSHSNSAAHRVNDPHRHYAKAMGEGKTQSVMDTKTFVRKIRIPADQVINRHAPNSVNTSTGNGTGKVAKVSRNTNSYYEPATMSPTLGSPDNSYVRGAENANVHYNGNDDYNNGFLVDSYHSMMTAKQQFLLRQSQSQSQSLTYTHALSGSGSGSPNSSNGQAPVLSKFNPAVVSLSKKWQEQQQMSQWAAHTKLLQDWRKTYERQLSMQAKPMPVGGFTTRTKEKFVPKAGPEIK